MSNICPLGNTWIGGGYWHRNKCPHEKWFSSWDCTSRNNSYRQNVKISFQFQKMFNLLLPVHFIPLKENARFFQFPIISQCQHFILSFFLSFILSFFHFFKSYHGDRAKSRDVVCIKWFFLKKTALWDLLWLLSLIWLFFLSLTDHVYRKSSLNAIYFDTFWEYNSALKKAALMGLRLIIKSRHFLFSFYPLFVLRSIPHRSRSLLLS